MDALLDFGADGRLPAFLQKLTTGLRQSLDSRSSICDKTNVRSRRELIGKVFFAHYEPRVRDKECRARAGQPFRGSPVVHG